MHFVGAFWYRPVLHFLNTSVLLTVLMCALIVVHLAYVSTP
jgi:hypothetical protein